MKRERKFEKGNKDGRKRRKEKIKESKLPKDWENLGIIPILHQQVGGRG